eukprot:g32001.t1
MASASAHFPGQGICNTDRVTVKKVEQGLLVNWTFFMMTVLLHCCSFQATDIFCPQDFPSMGYFDVAFTNVKQCDCLLRVLEEKR